MSDSRAVLLKLSVRDADVVRRELVAMGQQGEAALAKLEAASRAAAGGGPGGASQGVGLLEAVLEKTNGQLARLATQAMGGGSALSSMVSKAAGFLPMFGPAGIMAGAAASVATLALNLFSARDATDALADSQDRLERTLTRSIDFFETAAERAARLAQETRAIIALGFSAESRRVQSQLDAERRALETLEADRLRLIDANRNVPGFNPAAVLRDPIAQRRAEIERLEAALGQMEGERERALTAPSGAERDAAARAGRSGATPRPLLDTAGAVERAMDELTSSLDAYNTAQNLAAAGLDRGAGALAEYTRQQELLSRALDAGLISEEQFGAEVERTTLRLGEQLAEIRQRGTETQDITRQLGMTFSSMFEDAIVRGKRFSDVLKGVAADLARLIVRQSITTPLAGAANSLLKDFNLSGIGSSIAGALGFGGARASGGPVSGGMAYLVGERGPELFVPNSSGGIVPNHAMGGASWVVNIDARNSTPDAVARLEARLPTIIRGVVEDAARRGGGFSRSLRSA